MSSLQFPDVPQVCCLGVRTDLLTARAGCPVREGKPGAGTDSKAGRAGGLRAGYPPTLPTQGEQSRSSSSNQGQPRGHSDKTKPESEVSGLGEWPEPVMCETGPRHTCSKAQTETKAERLAPKRRGDRQLLRFFNPGRLRWRSWP